MILCSSASAGRRVARKGLETICGKGYEVVDDDDAKDARLIVGGPSRQEEELDYRIRMEEKSKRIATKAPSEVCN